MQALPIILGWLIALGCLIAAFALLRRKRLIDDLPTSKAKGVFIGFSELKGTAESQSPLTSYLAGAPCVLFRWQVQEKWSRIVTETYRDAQGRTQTRTRRESGWTEIARDEKREPFYLKDETGIVRIVPDKAKIEDEETFNETFGRSDETYFAKAPVQEIANSDHRRRFRETAIPLHSRLFVVGQARERQDIIAPEVAFDQLAPMFLISTRTERQVSTGYGLFFALAVFLGLVAAVGGVVAGAFLNAARPASSGMAPYLVTSGAFLVALGLGWTWTVYNSLVGLRQRVRQAWSQVDVQLRRRADLIPNLVMCVEGYRDHEKELLALVTELRSQVAGVDIRGLSRPLSALVEAYPELKAGGSFLILQRELSDTEQRIALARDFFNQTAAFYNIRLAIIPDRFVAAIAGLRPAKLFVASNIDRAPVEVHLASQE